MIYFITIILATGLVSLAFGIAPLLREIRDELTAIKKRLDAEEYKRRTGNN